MFVYTRDNNKHVTTDLAVGVLNKTFIKLHRLDSFVGYGLYFIDISKKLHKYCDYCD